MEPSLPTETTLIEPVRKPNWIMRGTFLLGGGLWLLYPVAPQVFGLMQGEPMRWAYLWAWLPMWLFVRLAALHYHRCRLCRNHHAPEPRRTPRAAL